VTMGTRMTSRTRGRSPLRPPRGRPRIVSGRGWFLNMEDDIPEILRKCLSSAMKALPRTTWRRICNRSAAGIPLEVSVAKSPVWVMMAAVSQRGLRPRPAQVSARFSGVAVFWSDRPPPVGPTELGDLPAAAARYVLRRFNSEASGRRPRREVAGGVWHDCPTVTAIAPSADGLHAGG
jgi:hypothetical protein